MEVRGPFGESVYFKEKGIKSLLKKKDHYFFVDSFFKKHPDFLEYKGNVLFVEAGEKLKTLDAFEKHISWLHLKGASKSSTVVAVGGGSVGDSIGFLASSYLRGVPLIHVPTTWLAAVDSSVGGKTALNFNAFKNQVGTVYAPKEILFFKNLIESSDVKDSEGEIFKTLILNLNKRWAKDITSSQTPNLIYFSDLVDFVNYKTKIVKKDPKDVKGVRAVLNLGHSLGHAFELKFKLSHSDAVLEGLRFAVYWSLQKKYLSKKAFERISGLLVGELPLISSTELKAFLEKDKKSSNDDINFIFISDKGPLVKKVSIDSMVKEYERQLKSEF